MTWKRKREYEVETVSLWRFVRIMHCNVWDTTKTMVPDYLNSLHN